MPQHWLTKKLTLLQLFVNQMDEANEHCNGTLNQINYSPLVTEIGTNESLTYNQAQKQADWIQFVLAMEK